MVLLIKLARYWEGFVKRKSSPTQKKRRLSLTEVEYVGHLISSTVIHWGEVTPGPGIPDWEGTSAVHWTGELLPWPCPEYDWDGSAPSKVDRHEEAQGIQKVDMDRWSYWSISLLIVRRYTSWKTLPLPFYRPMHPTMVLGLHVHDSESWGTSHPILQYVSCRIATGLVC